MFGVTFLKLKNIVNNLKRGKTRFLYLRYKINKYV